SALLVRDHVSSPSPLSSSVPSIVARPRAASERADVQLDRAVRPGLAKLPLDKIRADCVSLGLERLNQPEQRTSVPRVGLKVATEHRLGIRRFALPQQRRPKRLANGVMPLRRLHVSKLVLGLDRSPQSR